MSKKGIFITFEGCEGSGKTTLLSMISAYLKEKDIKAIVTREPGGTRIGEQTRATILENKNMNVFCEVALFAAARKQHCCEVIEPALRENKLVLCDRYIDSNLAYQGYAGGVGIEKVLKINNELNNLMPNITFFLDLPPEKGLARINKENREKNRLDEKELTFHQKVYQYYKMIAEKESDRVIRIDANQTTEKVFLDVLSILKKLILVQTENIEKGGKN
ncbi:MAG: dTMP kinase [Erysipelotrichaceae bacterium]